MIAALWFLVSFVFCFVFCFGCFGDVKVFSLGILFFEISCSLYTYWAHVSILNLEKYTKKPQPTPAF